MTDSQSLEADGLSWAVLLAHWVDFARSALALPDNAEGQRLRDSVSDIIQLQAVWFALQHLDELSTDERALGLDRAELLIEKHSGQLRERYTDTVMPGMIKELIHDARSMLVTAARV